MITLLYGQPGTGKSTLATGIARDYAADGKLIAANYPIDFAPSSPRANGPTANAFTLVLPDRPKLADLQMLGTGWREGEHGREDRAGLLVVDEAGPWLSSRAWQEKERQQIIDWFLHSRKLGWDVVMIAQAPSLLDKQVREAVIEGYARCRRTDRAKVAGFRLPRFHIAVARYGPGSSDPMLERWMYRGTVEHRMFQSYAMFNAKNLEPNGLYCTLPARLTKWADHKTLSQKVKDFIDSRSESVRYRVAPKPKGSLMQAIMRLPEEQRARHVQRFIALGAL